MVTMFPCIRAPRRPYAVLVGWLSPVFGIRYTRTVMPYEDLPVVLVLVAVFSFSPESVESEVLLM